MRKRKKRLDLEGHKNLTSQEQVNRLFYKILRRKNGTRKLKLMAAFNKLCKETGCKPIL